MVLGPYKIQKSWFGWTQLLMFIVIATAVPLMAAAGSVFWLVRCGLTIAGVMTLVDGWRARAGLNLRPGFITVDESGLRVTYPGVLASDIRVPLNLIEYIGPMQSSKTFVPKLRQAQLAPYPQKPTLMIVTRVPLALSVARRVYVWAVWPTSNRFPLPQPEASVNVLWLTLSPAACDELARWHSRTAYPDAGADEN